jgi:hypothetical protein
MDVPGRPAGIPSCAFVQVTHSGLVDRTARGVRAQLARANLPVVSDVVETGDRLRSGQDVAVLWRSTAELDDLTAWLVSSRARRVLVYDELPADLDTIPFQELCDVGPTAPRSWPTQVWSTFVEPSIGRFLQRDRAALIEILERLWLAYPGELSVPARHGTASPGALAADLLGPVDAPDSADALLEQLLDQRYEIVFNGFELRVDRSGPPVQIRGSVWPRPEPPQPSHWTFMRKPESRDEKKGRGGMGFDLWLRQHAPALRQGLRRLDPRVHGIAVVTCIAGAWVSTTTMSRREAIRLQELPDLELHFTTDQAGRHARP